MAMPQPPELKKYLDKRVSVRLNAGRSVSGRLRGFDVFMNVVLDEAVDESVPGARTEMGMVVVRGNSIVQMESLDRLA